MSFEEHVEATKRYLGAKYDVDLSDVRVERPIFSYLPNYNIKERRARIPYTSLPLIPFSYAASMGMYIIASRGAEYDSAVATALGLAGSLSLLLIARTSVTHELTHVVSHKLTEPEFTFDEFLSIHEEGKDPNIPRLNKSARNGINVVAFPFYLAMAGEYAGLIKLMDGKDRIKHIEKTRQRLSSKGADNVGQLYDELYDMRPRQFVEEHRMLKGLHRYSKTGKPEHLEKAHEDFLAHGGSPERAGKYMALLPRSIY